MFITIFLQKLGCVKFNPVSVAASNELVLINFYADWCRFSNLLAPIFDEAAAKVAEEFPNPGQVVMGKVDCDREGKLLYLGILEHLFFTYLL
jgi:Thioredoxin domain-containing protein